MHSGRDFHNLHKEGRSAGMRRQGAREFPAVVREEG
jgi:hypothetical protein